MHRLNKLYRLVVRSQFHYWRRRMIRAPFWLRINHTTTRIEAPRASGAIACYCEIAIEDIYHLTTFARSNKPEVIADIGANIGVFSKASSMLMPTADIYAYEPGAEPLPYLQRNARGTRIEVAPYAILDQAGRGRLDSTGDSTTACLVTDANGTTQCLAATDVAHGRPIDLLKMDCEGSEWSILQDRSLLQRTKNMAMEYHLYDGHTVRELETLIEQGGHRITLLTHNDAYEGKFGMAWSTRAK